MKQISNRILLLFLAFVSIYGYTISCTHKELVLPTQATGTATITRGNAVFSPGTETIGDTTQWKLDQVHSSVLWSGNYLQEAGLLTGRFNSFGMNSLTPSLRQNYAIASGQPVLDTSWAFNESDPSKTFFNGYVQMNTSNTGEPGRDDGCYLSYVFAPKKSTSQQNLTEPNIAVIRSTNIILDPNSAGYIVTMVMSWRGGLAAIHDTTINGTLTYIKRATIGAGTASPYDVFGLQLNFKFNCRSFGITSTQISDIINVQCNMNFNNK